MELYFTLSFGKLEIKPSNKEIGLSWLWGMRRVGIKPLHPCLSMNLEKCDFELKIYWKNVIFIVNSIGKM